MKPFIDHSVYPDRSETDELIEDFENDLARADYVERICGAWDFDIPPDRETFELFNMWRDIFDRYPLPHSPAYHAFRTIFGWPEVPRIQSQTGHLSYAVFDRSEGRDPDPCVNLI